jgi:GT2 family glycosyltransferase
LGAIAVKMVLPNRHHNPQAALFTKALAEGFAKVDWICGAFMLMPRTVYLDLGGLAEDIFMYGEDAELCWRARQKGVGCYYVPSAAIVHLRKCEATFRHCSCGFCLSCALWVEDLDSRW